MTFNIATAQSLITCDVSANGQHVRDLMKDARDADARLIHFPEGALSGYVKAQIEDWNGVDWPCIRAEAEQIAVLAKKLGIWVVLGCNHHLSAPHRPHNSLYVFSDKGELVYRYDKRWCSHNELCDWYTPGREPVVFDINEFRFGCTLCIEVQFPELFLEYERLGIDCMLFSAHSDDPMFETLSQAHAATYNYWISVSAPAQCSDGLPAALIGPDGRLIARGTTDGKPKLVIAQLNRDEPQYSVALTKARPWRSAARAGDIYRVRQVDDDRSSDHASL